MTRDQKVVELRLNRLPHLNHPDWTAFASVLRSLWALERLPVEELAEGVYGFAELGSHFTAEQLLDEIDMTVSNLRVAIQNHRAAQSNL